MGLRLHFFFGLCKPIHNHSSHTGATFCGVAVFLFALATRKLKGNLTLVHSNCWLMQTVRQNRCQILFKTILEQTVVSNTET